MTIKAYVDEKNSTSLFVCPHCGFQKSFSVLPFKNKKKNLTIKCQCGESTEIQIEFRQYFRKQVGFPGVCVIDKKKIRCDIIIRDISLGGVGIEFVFVNKRHLTDIELGDIIFIEFKLDNIKEILIIKRCIIRLKLNSIVGAEFRDQKHAREIGFFMMQ